MIISILVTAEILPKTAIISIMMPLISILMMIIAKITLSEAIPVESLISVEIGLPRKSSSSIIITIIGIVTIIGIIRPLASIYVVHPVIKACIIVPITVLVILGLTPIVQQFYYCVQF